jgi:hypothetical protein
MTATRPQARRGWKATATTVSLPQSARCQLAWHSNIQTVAPPHRLQRLGCLDALTTHWQQRTYDFAS